MIHPHTKLCIGTMKFIQWPTLARSVSKSLWPSRAKGQITTLPFSCSSTMAHAQSNDSESSKADLKTAVESKSAASTQGFVTQKALPRKELDAVMKVKSLSEAVETCSTFNPEQRINALKNLVRAQIRPLPLVQALTEGIFKSSEELNLKQLSDLLFVLGKLKYVNEDVLSRTCEALRKELKSNSSAAVVGSSISSLRKLQWKDPDLLNDCSEWLQKNFLKFQNPSTFIYTLALQNHSPPNIEDLFELTWKDVQKLNNNPTHKVDLVWSINVLNCSFAKEKTRESLNEFFHPKFLDKLGSSPSDIPVWTKLWNLHAIARSAWGQTEDFIIPEIVKSNISKTLKKSNKDTMVLEIAQLLFKDMDAKLYSTDVPSHMGFPIDLVFRLDKQMNAVPLHLAATDCSRVAVMVHSYHECCQPTREPNGYRIFAMRLLEDDYRVISVPYHILGGGYSQVHEYFESVLSEVVRNRN